MSLSQEWKRRIEHWERVMPECFYRPIGKVDLSGFITLQQLSPEQALQAEFKPMPSGTTWGAAWEYGWFKGQLTLPPDAAGQRIALRLEPGHESLVWVNGQAAGARDWAHTEITLALSGQPGDHFEILLECYAGHGQSEVGGGPVPYGKLSVPLPAPAQATVKDSTFGIWDEQLYQLWLDFSALYRLSSALDANSLRVEEIDQALCDTTLLVDLELPPTERSVTVAAGRARLLPLLQCTNGSTTPLMYAFGHAHLDVAWLWPLAETERKMARTVSNTLALIAEYPEYRFLQSQPHLYTMLKRLYPELYERFKLAVHSGGIIADGGMWVEADTNLTGGESLIRQIVHGRRFFKEEFGIESTVLWLPDVFGYSGALPQILRGCGMVGFTTQKIFWTYNGGDPFPYNTFMWEGIDGTEILAHIFNDYNTFPRPDIILERWNMRNQKNHIKDMMMPFGHGDGGGGPTRDHLEYLRRSTNLEGVPRVKMSSPVEFFAEQARRSKPQERYVGELYFQAHRGTYTSQAQTKRGNRRSELTLREAEMWGVAARALQGFNFSCADLDAEWKTLLLNQFHDIIPGSSIHRVHAETAQMQAAIIEKANSVAHAAASALAGDSGAGYTVFNSLSWPRRTLVQLPSGAGSFDEAQVIGKDTVMEVEVPACGWGPLSPASTQPGSAVSGHIVTGGFILENENIRVAFDQAGEITSLYDKVAGSEFSAGPGNHFLLYKDVPNWFDAWDIDSSALQNPVALTGPVEVELAASGPLVAQLHLSRMINQSRLTQTISLQRGSRRLDFATSIDWQESHRLLKVAFPVNIHANEAIHEIQFGHIRRPNHRSRPYDADRFEVCNHKWSALAEEGRGVAVLNDSKYGLNVLGNSINLTLLKSALAPDPVADKGLQSFCYSLFIWNGSLAESRVVEEAYQVNVPVLVMPGQAETRSLFSLDQPNIVIETVKPAEDGSGNIVIRLYECKRTTTRALLHTSLPVLSAAVTDMVEAVLNEVDCLQGQIVLEFHPFEIKTILLRMA